MFQTRKSRTQYRRPGQPMGLRALGLVLVVIGVVVPAAGARWNGSVMPGNTLGGNGEGPAIASSSLEAGGDADSKTSPACSIREIPYEDLKGRKYLGKHGWTGQGGQGPWNWYSDAANTMKELSICRYDFTNPTRTVTLTIGGGQIEFKNRDGSGIDGGVMLALYHESPPSSLFKGKDLKFDKAALNAREWKKKEGQASITIKAEVVRVSFKTPVSKVHLVVVGVDPWINTSVDARITSLTVSSQAPAAMKAKRK